MLVIRPEQMEAFRYCAETRFFEEIVSHGKTFSPALCGLLGEEPLRAALRSGMKKAGKYGFTCRGSLRLFIELMFLFGSAFDTDPQYAMFGDILRNSDHEMLRAQRMHEAHRDYLEKVAESSREPQRTSLAVLSIPARLESNTTKEYLARSILRELKKAFPRKVEFTGEAPVLALIHEAETEATRHGFAGVHQIALLVALLFVFGHGCTTDPLYPWIARTLEADGIVGSQTRAEQLERKAVTWFNRLLGPSEARIYE